MNDDFSTYVGEPSWFEKLITLPFILISSVVILIFCTIRSFWWLIIPLACVLSPVIYALVNR